VHRLRGGEALTEPDRLPQAWVPRAVNTALAAFLLLFLVPLFRHFGSRSGSVQVVLGFLAVPFVLLTLACLGQRAGGAGLPGGALRAADARVPRLGRATRVPGPAGSSRAHP
jgi:hypothetical protein